MLLVFYIYDNSQLHFISIIEKNSLRRVKPDNVVVYHKLAAWRSSMVQQERNKPEASVDVVFGLQTDKTKKKKRINLRGLNP
jgi:hypothetical protein